MHRKHGDQTDRYGLAFSKLWDFIENHLLDPVNAGWHAQTTRPGRLTGDDGKAKTDASLNLEALIAILIDYS